MEQDKTEHTDRLYVTKENVGRAMKENKLIVFLLIMFIGIAVRMVNINQPLLEYNASRQVQTATIARNMAFNGADLLMPEIDDQGRGPTYLMQELPLITGVTAALARPLGNLPEWLLRSTSVIAFVAAALFFFAFVRDRYGLALGMLSLIIFSFSPLSILMSRVYQPDMAMVAFALICFYAISRLAVTGRVIWAFAAVLAFSAAVLLKITNLYLILPIIALFWGLPTTKRPGKAMTIICVMVALIPIVWWWGMHAPTVREAFPNAHDTFGAEYLIQSMKAHLFYKPFYKEFLAHLSISALTPVLFLAAIPGCVVAYRRKDTFLFTWTLSVIAFLFAVPEQSKQEYYMLSIVPLGAILASLGLEDIYGSLKSRSTRRVFIFAVSITALLFSARVAAPKFLDRQEYRDVVDAGLAVQDISGKDALIVASHGYSQDLLYYCKRKGWSFAVNRDALKKYVKNLKIDDNIERMEGVEDTIGELESLRLAGARFLVSVPSSAVENMPVFGEYLKMKYDEVLREGDRYVIYGLKSQVEKTN